MLSCRLPSSACRLNSGGSLVGSTWCSSGAAILHSASFKLDVSRGLDYAKETMLWMKAGCGVVARSSVLYSILSGAFWQYQMIAWWLKSWGSNEPLALETMKGSNGVRKVYKRRDMSSLRWDLSYGSLLEAADNQDLGHKRGSWRRLDGWHAGLHATLQLKTSTTLMDRGTRFCSFSAVTWHHWNSSSVDHCCSNRIECNFPRSVIEKATAVLESSGVAQRSVLGAVGVTMTLFWCNFWLFNF